MKTLFAYYLLLNLIPGGASDAHAYAQVQVQDFGAATRYSCQELNPASGQRLPARLWILIRSGAHVPDVTQFQETPEHPQGETFVTNYDYSQSPFYRWGYSDLYSTDLPGLGMLTLTIEKEGPNLMNASKFNIRAIFATLQSKSGGSRYFTCKLQPAR